MLPRPAGGSMPAAFAPPAAARAAPRHGQPGFAPPVAQPGRSRCRMLALSGRRPDVCRVRSAGRCPSRAPARAARLRAAGRPARASALLNAGLVRLAARCLPRSLRRPLPEPRPGTGSPASRRRSPRPGARAAECWPRPASGPMPAAVGPADRCPGRAPAQAARFTSASARRDRFGQAQAGSLRTAASPGQALALPNAAPPGRRLNACRVRPTDRCPGRAPARAARLRTADRSGLTP